MAASGLSSTSGGIFRSDTLCWLLRNYSVPNIEIELSDEIPSVFYKGFGQNNENTRRKLIQLIRWTSGKAEDLVKN